MSNTGEYNHLAWLWDNASSAHDHYYRHTVACFRCTEIGEETCPDAQALAANERYWEDLALAEEASRKDALYVPESTRHEITYMDNATRMVVVSTDMANMEEIIGRIFETPNCKLVAARRLPL